MQTEPLSVEEKISCDRGAASGRKIGELRVAAGEGKHSADHQPLSTVP